MRGAGGERQRLPCLAGGAARKRLSDLQMPTPIQSIHRELKGAYGSLRMAREPRERGFPASQARIDPIDDESVWKCDKCFNQMESIKQRALVEELKKELESIETRDVDW